MSRALSLMRFLIAILALCLALVFGVVFNDPLAFIIAYFILAVMVYEILHRIFALRGVRVSRQILNPARGSAYRITAGDAVDVVTRVEVKGWSRICFVRWRHVVDNIAGQDTGLSGVCLPWSRNPRVFAGRVHHLNRGQHELGVIEWSVSDVFGLQVLRGQADVHHQVIVHPRRYQVSNWKPFSFAESGVLKPRSHSVAADAQGYFSGVREYRHGDRISQVHWPATAHRDRLMSKEIPAFEKPTLVLVLETCWALYGPASSAGVSGFHTTSEAAGALVPAALSNGLATPAASGLAGPVGLDGTLGSHLADAQFELAVSLYASLVQQAVSQNSSVVVAFLRDGKLWQVPVGMGELSAVMDALAQVAMTAESFASEHRRLLLFESPSSIAIVSPRWADAYSQLLTSRNGGAVDWIVPFVPRAAATSGAVPADIADSFARFSDLALRHRCLFAQQPKGKGRPIELMNPRLNSR